jgi:hypothetical protein
MTRATDQDIQKARELRSPHVNAVVAELEVLRVMAKRSELYQDALSAIAARGNSAFFSAIDAARKVLLEAAECK